MTVVQARKRSKVVGLVTSRGTCVENANPWKAVLNVFAAEKFDDAWICKYFGGKLVYFWHNSVTGHFANFWINDMRRKNKKMVRDCTILHFPCRAGSVDGGVGVCELRFFIFLTKINEQYKQIKRFNLWFMYVCIYHQKSAFAWVFRA